MITDELIYGKPTGPPAEHGTDTTSSGPGQTIKALLALAAGFMVASVQHPNQGFDATWWVLFVGVTAVALLALVFLRHLIRLATIGLVAYGLFLFFRG